LAAWASASADVLASRQHQNYHQQSEYYYTDHKDDSVSSPPSTDLSLFFIQLRHDAIVNKERGGRAGGFLLEIT
jgi:hypothetical protein